MRGGTKIVFRMPRGRPEFFAHAEGGTRIFLRMPRRDQKKLATRDHKLTPPPIPVKNDSSLRPELDKKLRINRNGFRPGRSTVSQILALRCIIEGVKCNNLPS